ncbi:T7 exonuclease [Polymorphobacter arshaanensis]|uniref:T7 exonuclease n=1 Tax=Glacieibacterium arshaanense TaxID=2511025 RepID=A0A4Y9ERC6_9SPHN|nr:T7 exonuclease [Polymorphobacter arshaanensis]TFU06154.1 T7 exonuclease [Polymorphobacter arshaanensis]
MATQLLIDADFSLYRDCSVVEREAVFTNEAGHSIHVLNSSEEEALEVFIRTIKKLEKTLGTDDTVLVFSGAENFRKDVWSGYKANRKATRKPLCYWSIIDRLKAEGTYKVVEETCLEGDDYIGILATRTSPVDRIIVSDDKDMQTLPNVKIWRMDGMVHTTEESADAFWLLQTLMGDTTDGYKGCPGLGPVLAQRVLDKAGDPWGNVLQAYHDGCRKNPKALEDGQTSDDLALLNARLARILRHTDWDSKNRKPILWTPPELAVTNVPG